MIFLNDISKYMISHCNYDPVCYLFWVIIHDYLYNDILVARHDSFPKCITFTKVHLFFIFLQVNVVFIIIFLIFILFSFSISVAFWF